LTSVGKAARIVDLPLHDSVRGSERAKAQLSQRSLSACWIIASPLARISADWAPRMFAIARALPSADHRQKTGEGVCGEEAGGQTAAEVSLG
jgi:hypothetical protein